MNWGNRYTTSTSHVFFALRGGGALPSLNRRGDGRLAAAPRRGRSGHVTGPIGSRAHGSVCEHARRSDSLLTVRVPASQAAALARELQDAGLLRYSEPDLQMQRAERPRAFAAGLPADPLSVYQWR